MRVYIDIMDRNKLFSTLQCKTDGLVHFFDCIKISSVGRRKNIEFGCQSNKCSSIWAFSEHVMMDLINECSQYTQIIA